MSRYLIRRIEESDAIAGLLGVRRPSSGSPLRAMLCWGTKQPSRARVRAILQV